LGFREKLVKCSAIEEFAVEDDGLDVAGVANVLKRVAV
jgi:hypothetical protein